MEVVLILPAAVTMWAASRVPVHQDTSTTELPVQVSQPSCCYLIPRETSYVSCMLVCFILLDMNYNDVSGMSETVIKQTVWKVLSYTVDADL